MGIKYSVTGDRIEDVQVPCLKCAGRTFHRVMTEAAENGDEHHDHGSYQWQELYQVVQCRGCKTMSFRLAKTNSEDMDRDDDGTWIESVTEAFYPARIEGLKGIDPTKLQFLPPVARKIYDEALRALTNEQPILAGVGLRALVEAVCKEKSAKGSDLLKKIDNLVDLKVLTDDAAKVLHHVRQIGNKAAHEAKPETVARLSIAMTVVENLLTNVYILPKVVAAEFPPDDDEI